MGYTHYWQQKKSFSKRAWREICADVAEILKNVVEVQGIPLDATISPDWLDINGVEGEFCESLVIHRERPEKVSWKQQGWDFTKTCRERYDVAVTAVLI
jgi:hypothetical protein